MYHPLVYMTTECRNYRNRQCQNRTCAFYHSEAQRQAAQENRENLIAEIEETERREREAEENRASEVLEVDLESSNHFPSLPETDSSKPVPVPKRSYAESAKTKKKEKTEFADSKKPRDDKGLISSLNEDSQVYSPMTHAEPITSPPFGAQSVFGASTPPFSSIGHSEFPFHNSQEPEQNPFTFGGSGAFGFDAGANDSSNSFLDQGLFRSPYFKEPFSLGGTGFSHAFSSDACEAVSDNLKIFRSKKISMNSQGIVYEGIWSELGEEQRVAVKEIDLTHSMNRGIVLDHLSKLRSFQHPNIIQSRQVIHPNERAFVVMNYYDNSLASYMENSREKLVDSNGAITALCKSFIVQLCSVLEYLHQNEMLHRNLEVCCFVFFSSSYFLLDYVA